MDLAAHFRWNAIPTTRDEALGRPVTDLLAVDAAAASALTTIGIATVFDLGASGVFAEARAIAIAARDPDARLSGDLVSPPASDAAARPVSSMRRLPSAAATALQGGLGISTIWELANWAPYVAAQSLVSDAIQPSEDAQAEALRPLMGQFPTERVYYSTFVMLDAPQPTNPVSFDGPVGLKSLLAGGFGFAKPAIGAVITFAQSWHVQGITLGQLLHSLALAPGESTRIAMIDWSRRTSATSSESISEQETLSNTTDHSRAVSEIQEGVAQEMQEGGSSSSTKSRSSSEATAETVGSGGLAAAFGPSWDVSNTSESAKTSSSANSSAWSSGNRSVMASMNQEVNDRTEQHASSSRSRRASAIREVSQSEHEGVSTRVVANYNHMHALTVQYYEVVQLYRVSTRINRADRCLFIPVQPIDFKGPDAWDLIERFRGALVRRALTRRARALLLDETSSVTVIPAAPTRIDLPARRAFELGIKQNRVQTTAVVAPASDDSPPKVATVSKAASSLDLLRAPAGGGYIWHPGAIASVSHIIGRAILRPNVDGLFFPDDTQLLALSFDDILPTKYALSRTGGPAITGTVGTNLGRVDLAEPIALSELTEIALGHAGRSKVEGTVTLELSYLGRRFSAPAVPVELAATEALQRVARLQSDRSDRRNELLLHLRNNHAHYANAIYRSLGASELTILLSPFVWAGKPLLEQIEPKVLNVIGNYIVVRAPVADDEPSGIGGLAWRALLTQRGLQLSTSDDRLIPVPTGGVFAEAVLGRSNSAEKLDLTRFWNWQDSPTPMTATDIAPIATGSRATTEDLKPGQLAPPVLNIVNPTSLPDPQGVGAVISALSNGNMFRDMSGLAGTQALVQAGLQETLRAATAAGGLASENLKASMQKQISALQTVADVAKAAMGAGGASPNLPPIGGVSGEGARINYGKDMDARGIPASPGGGPSPGIGAKAPGNAAGGDTGGGSSTGGGWDRSVDAPTNEGNAFNRALWGQMGESGGSTTGKLFQVVSTPLDSTEAEQLPWLEVPSKDVATSAADKVDMEGESDKIELGMGALTVGAWPIRNWRTDGVEQYGGNRIGAQGHAKTREQTDITTIVVHETVGATWSILGSPLSVHFHVERDGAIVQHNQVWHHANHVGPYNRQSIGIEHVHVPFVASAADALPGAAAPPVGIPWGNLALLAFPPDNQLRASYDLIVRLRSTFSAISGWPQIRPGTDLFGSEEPGAVERWFITSTTGWDLFAERGLGSVGTISHSALIGHSDGAIFALYGALRDRGLAHPAAVTTMRDLFGDSARQKMIVVQIAGGGRNVHLIRVTDVL